jgi:glutamate--cysteine ligase
LVQSLKSGTTQADRWLRDYHGVWAGDLTRIYAEARL